MLTGAEIREYNAVLDVVERGRRPNGRFLARSKRYFHALAIAVLAKPVLTDDGVELGVPELEQRARRIADAVKPNAPSQTLRARKD